ncbi:MAG: hypothetical protein IT474_02190 [Arenimonas sp.]|nr:hypothetical protein [Arenimonas sp.]
MTAPALTAAQEQAFAQAAAQLARIMAQPDSPFRRLPRPGFRRGIDFYTGRGLLAALANALQAYRAKLGAFPDLAEPRDYNEKILWFKFFGELKVPEAGDKLATARFIPEAWRDRIRCPTVVWHSPAPELPANDRIAPGVYYLKSNHGSGMFRKIRYPLAEAERAELQALCRDWLARDYGLTDGEWWYAAFPRRILLERDVCDGAPPVCWNIHVLGGQIGLVELFDKNAQPLQVTWLDARLRPMAVQMDGVNRIAAPRMPADPDSLLAAASAIAAPFEFARVDFFIGADGTAYLGEVTFSPSNAMSRRPAEIERQLGDMLAIGSRREGGIHDAAENQ